MHPRLDWLQSLKHFFINSSYYILVASLTLMALFFKKTRAIRVRLATSICYDTLMKNCFKDWSQSNPRSDRHVYLQIKFVIAFF